MLPMMRVLWSFMGWCGKKAFSRTGINGVCEANTGTSTYAYLLKLKVRDIQVLNTLIDSGTLSR